MYFPLSVFFSYVVFQVFRLPKMKRMSRVLEPDKKAMKLVKEAENVKNARMDRIKAYTDAIALAPDNGLYLFLICKL